MEETTRKYYSLVRWDMLFTDDLVMSAINEMFIALMEETTRKYYSLVRWDMLFTDDLVMSAETKSQPIWKIKTWNNAL